MLLVFDSNVYIFGFGLIKVPTCEKVIIEIIENPSSYTLRIFRTIIEEVRRHLSPEDFIKFIKVVNKLTTIDEDIVVPFEIVFKYESIGLKPADAFIAAYTEWTGAEVLVTENRHFLTHQSDLPFKVLPAERCLKLLK